MSDVGTRVAVREPVRPGPGSGRRRFRADVQGLRAVAVGLVLLYHAGVPVVGGGYVGVDVFFVISGFLITSHLVTSLRRNGRIGFADFYARRARRILPASFVVLVVTALALWAVAPPLALAGMMKDALATVTYVPNIWFAVQDTDYLADHAASPFQHYWSLGVEEQFYLLWPLLLVVLTRRARGRGRQVVVGIAALAVLSLIAGVWATWWNPSFAFFLLPTRAWELLAGGLVAAAVLQRPPRLPPVLAAAGGWLGLAAVVVAAVVFDSGTPFPGAAALLPVLGTATVIFCGSVQRPLGPTRLLSVPVLQHLGLISYSLYLVHWPLLIVPAEALGRELSTWERLALGVGLALPLAVLLHRFVEVPARSARALIGRPPRLTLNATAAVTVVLALLLGGAVSRAENGPIAGASVAPAAPSTPAAPPRGTGVVPTNLTPSLRQVDQDVPDVYDRPGCHLDTVVATVQDCRFGRRGAATRVALFGDSHAAQWLPALERLAAEGGALEIATYTKSSCPSVGVTTVLKGVAYASCDRWRTAVIAHLTADAPDVVALSNDAYHELLGAPGPAARTREWTGGLARTIDQLRRPGAGWSWWPTHRGSTSLRRCASPPTWTTSRPASETLRSTSIAPWRPPSGGRPSTPAACTPTPRPTCATGGRARRSWATCSSTAT